MHQLRVPLQITRAQTVSIKRKFALENNGDPIFKKPYDGSTSEVVNVTANTITLPNHFFVTGEEVSYAHTIEELVFHLSISE